MHTAWKPPVSLQYQENFTWTIHPLHLGQSQPQYYLSRQVWLLQCHYAVLLLFSPFWELMDSGFNMSFSATLVWAYSTGFCLFVVAIFRVVYIRGKLQKPFWKEENHILMPIHFCLCHFVFSDDLS